MDVYAVHLRFLGLLFFESCTVAVSDIVGVGDGI